MYQCEIDIIDPNVVFRMIGFYEYRQALAQLDLVIANSTTEEKQAIDLLIQERMGYQVLVMVDLGNGARKIRKTGLDWMVALARVELGSMVAALTDSENPFGNFSPTAFDRNAYRVLMTEGYRIHRALMKADPELFPKPNTIRTEAVLVQEQRLQLLEHWCRAMIQIEAANPVTARALSADLSIVEKTREKLTSEFAGRVLVRTGTQLNIAKGKNQ